MAGPSRVSSRKNSSEVTIEFGPDRKRHNISRKYLSDLPWFNDDDDIYTSGVDEDIGIILLDYLSTGRYEPPRIDPKFSDRIRLRLDLQTTLRVFLVTEIWPILKLRKITRRKIQTLSKSITVCDLVEIVDEELSNPDVPKLPRSRQWLYNHLSNILEKESLEDSGILDELMEFTDFEDLSLCKELTKRIIRFQERRINRADE
ncbi:hypothetical protein EPUL_005055 [Erysiphe pulchra]|uniref:BTB domain-containing protein n=1 Tax=Erysiphe pulchra TaxID=225359 RepID=A0A2S4PMX0_9PEZI|nr:hypothetical protein EPUL_005055 [Erysiphe pulchra]